MTGVQIYRPAKTAMQSGRAASRLWVLEFEPEEGNSIEPLMGWISSADVRGQVRIRFPSRDAAVAFAKKGGYAYQVREPAERRPRPKRYADNFR